MNLAEFELYELEKERKKLENIIEKTTIYKMNEKTSYIKLPNITVSKLQDVIDFLDDNEIEYEEYYAENLQNRIDKAIEYIEKK